MGPAPLDAEFDFASNGVGPVPAFEKLRELWAKQVHNSKHVWLIAPHAPSFWTWDLAAPVENQILYPMVYLMCQLSPN